VLAPDSANADAAERKDSGFHRCAANYLDNRRYVDARFEIG
jgi:hypothetical protein